MTVPLNLHSTLFMTSRFFQPTILIMKLKTFLLFTTLALACNTICAQNTDEAKRRPRHHFDADCPDVHDPVMAYEDGKYYVFATGNGISVMSSSDMKTWKEEKPVFSKAPQWAVDAIPGYWGHTWAPDIHYSDGLWYLYYSCSSFGKNTSAIGVAVNKTLNPLSPQYAWEDKGMVMCSTPEKNNWNAIDPNLIIDKKGTPWLFFGSFWDGIQMIKLDKNMHTPAKHAKYKTISRRKDSAKSDSFSGEANDNAVEAPFIIRHGKYYYLFVSFDYCCRGLKSTYKTAVGRSKKITGPYTDKDGRNMEHGGGTILLAADDNYAGIGHCSVYEFDRQWYIIAHAYSKAHNGASKLLIRKMNFDLEGWPILE